MTAIMEGLKFEATVYDDNVYGVWAVTPDGRSKIAEVMWDGGEWIFRPCDKEGFILDRGTRLIDVDPARRLHLNQIEVANAMSRAEPDTNETVQAALDLALDTRRRQFRDDSREDAILGARLFARGWYPKWRDL